MCSYSYLISLVLRLSFIYLCSLSQNKFILFVHFVRASNHFWHPNFLIYTVLKLFYDAAWPLVWLLRCNVFVCLFINFFWLIVAINDSEMLYVNHLIMAFRIIIPNFGTTGFKQ